MSPLRALNFSCYKLGSQGIFVSGLKSSLEVIHNNVGSYFLLIQVFNQAVCERKFSWFLGSTCSSCHLPMGPAILNVQCSSGSGAPAGSFTLFWSVCKQGDVWLSVITFFAFIWEDTWTIHTSILSESFLTFYANLSYSRTMGRNMFSWDTFSGFHLTGKAWHIISLTTQHACKKMYI